jgi:hypothetical protein
MRYAFALSVIPVLLWWFAWPARPPPPVAAKPVEAEGVRAQRMDTGTFKVRWASVTDLPPSVIEVEKIVEYTVPQPRPASVVRRASLRADICARHGLRKVEHSRGRSWKGWRCSRRSG